jgi:sugar phosphate isomerase/epimerase
MAETAIGVDLADLRLGAKEALRAAARMQFRAVELPAAEGETSPKNLSASGRRHLLRFVEGLGLSMPALSADLPLLRLTDPAAVDERVERTCAIIELAADLGVAIVTAAAGALTHPRTGVPSEVALAALRCIGEFADSRGTIFALRPSCDTADRLAAVFDAVGCPQIRIGLDPAALVMSGVNPLSPLERFAGQLALIHFRDATMGSADRSGSETRLGEGEVDLRGIVSALEAAEYSGPLFVRRTDTNNPMQELAEAQITLKRLLRVG